MSKDETQKLLSSKKISKMVCLAYVHAFGQSWLRMAFKFEESWLFTSKFIKKKNKKNSRFVANYTCNSVVLVIIVVNLAWPFDIC